MNPKVSEGLLVLLLVLVVAATLGVGLVHEGIALAHHIGAALSSIGGTGDGR